jgi:hypothetical protein
MYYFTEIQVYTTWFLFFFLLPLTLFLKLTSIDIELIHLKGLKLTPQLLDGNIVGTSNNFDVFIKNHPNLKEANIILKLFKNICDDANNGLSYNPNFYISSYKTTLHKFVLWMLLGSHIPLMYLLLICNITFAATIKYQVCCYILIYILEIMIQYKHAQFSKVFYTNWYNKILNFDLLTINLIRNDVEKIKELSNSHDLLDVVNKFEASNTVLANKLLMQSEMLSAKLDELINIQQKMNGINAQSVLISFDDTIGKYREINAHIQVISENIRSSFESITMISKSREDEINTINKNTGLLLDIREQFKDYQSEIFKTELAQLQMITASLDNNVNKAFVSAVNIITQNFERLENGYDKFFDMCKLLSESISSNYEEKTASALALFFNTLMQEYSEMRKQTEKITEVVERTSEATELLCKTVYDFTQYTMAPNFMEKISKFVNFSSTLKNATEKLISYENLASLSEVTVNDHNEKKRKVKKKDI